MLEYSMLGLTPINSHLINFVKFDQKLSSKFSKTLFASVITSSENIFSNPFDDELIKLLTISFVLSEYSLSCVGEILY